QRIINLLPKQRQNLLFSATFSPEIQKLARSFMVNPTLIEVARQNATSDNIEQVLFSLEKDDHKRAAVSYLIQSKKLSQVIVFANTKLGCARLARQLEREGITATAIHGDKTQSERTKSLEAFKAGEVVAMVATDVAARGLDIAHLPFVINYDLPTTAEDYVHRIGRTGRAGAKGTAYSFFAKGNERVLKDIEKLIGKDIPKAELDGFVVPTHSGRPEESARGASRSARPTAAREERPRRGRQYSVGPRFDESAPIHRDAEFERLRAKLANLEQKNDSIFDQPYDDDASSNDEQSTASSAPKNRPSAVAPSRKGGSQKSKAPVAVLLGGSPRG
ncbi:MAG: DEAD/DEAH box helicase, partial [Limnobacter sp.]|nr:DEAD/DEAH box helicase [Limnobacter sp.]